MWAMLTEPAIYCNRFNKSGLRSTIGCVEVEIERRVDPRKQRTTDALMATAQQMFAERPLEEVTVEEIGQYAGVAVGSIYNNFGSEEGLYAAVVGRALDVDRDYMDRAYTPERNPIEQLLAASEQYLRFALDHPQFFRMLAFPTKPGPYPAAAETAQARRARHCRRWAAWPEGREIYAAAGRRPPDQPAARVLARSLL
jgi:AcrR family transcriptional regulator